MDNRVLGLHHMTAISGPAQENVDFYAGVLGLRLVKTTVNFDDPSAHHLYYGDGLGSPGSILTFFPYPEGREGRVGNGMVGVTSLAIPPGSVGYWLERLQKHGLPAEVKKRGDYEVLSLQAPDGLLLELVAWPDFEVGVPWRDMPVPPEHAIAAMHGIRIFADTTADTGKVLTEILGLEEAGGLEDAPGVRYRVPGARKAGVVEVLERPGASWGRGGHGTVHHIAFRTTDDSSQLAFQSTVQQAGLHVSPVMDRNYFHSIYFREPGHVLFEIATDGPGFAVDEVPEALGTSLKLPEQYEPHRAVIEAALPKLRIPEPVR